MFGSGNGFWDEGLLRCAAVCRVSRSEAGQAAASNFEQLTDMAWNKSQSLYHMFGCWLLVYKSQSVYNIFGGWLLGFAGKACFDRSICLPEVYPTSLLSDDFCTLEHPKHTGNIADCTDTP